MRGKAALRQVGLCIQRQQQVSANVRNAIEREGSGNCSDHQQVFVCFSVVQCGGPECRAVIILYCRIVFEIISC